MKSYLREILAIFPRHCYAFAYGSAVFRQTPNLTGTSISKTKWESNNIEKRLSESQKLPAKVNGASKMIDFIIVVDDTLAWHQENLRKNNAHYSFLKYFGPRLITKVQEDSGANCYFNTLIPYNDRTMIKYGVIKKSHFVNDLLDWDHLYVAGRLQKPVQVISFDHSSVSEVIEFSEFLVTYALWAAKCVSNLISYSITKGRRSEEFGDRNEDQLPERYSRVSAAVARGVHRGGALSYAGRPEL